MPIDTSCPICERKLRVPDKVAGKRIKCPQCQSVVSVPGNGSSVGTGVAADGQTAAARWYMMTADGSQYGPVSRAELDQWFAQRRITDQCQLLEEGAAQWQWASSVYPQLAAPAATDTSAAAPPMPPANGSLPGFGDSQAATAPTSPFSFAAADASPAGRLRSRPRRSASVSMLAFLSCFLAIIGAFRAITMLADSSAMATRMQAQIEREGNRNAQQAAQNTADVASRVIIAIVIGIAVYSAVLLLAGYGLFQRRQWGRILTFLLAVPTGLIGLYQLLFVILGALSLELEGIALLLWLLLATTVFASLAYAIGAFIILLQRKYAEEFR